MSLNPNYVCIQKARLLTGKSSGLPVHEPHRGILTKQNTFKYDFQHFWLDESLQVILKQAKIDKFHLYAWEESKFSHWPNQTAQLLDLIAPIYSYEHYTCMKTLFEEHKLDFFFLEVAPCWCRFPTSPIQ